jgi:hypothetical protein
MCKERVVFFVAGSLVGLGTLLAWLVSPWWLLVTGFVGVNMFQSSLTGFCPLTKILEALKVRRCAPAASPLN